MRILLWNPVRSTEFIQKNNMQQISSILKGILKLKTNFQQLVLKDSIEPDFFCVPF